MRTQHDSSPLLALKLEIIRRWGTQRRAALELKVDEKKLSKIITGECGGDFNVFLALQKSLGKRMTQQLIEEREDIQFPQQQ